jgi:hypothetical protein
MTAQQLISEQTKIDAEVWQIAGQLELEVATDGVISPEHYSERKIKTSWVLREPHDDEGGYDYKKDIVDRLNGNRIGRNKYFDPMRFLEYSLNNNFALWDDIPDSDKDVDVSNLLLNTAFTNINKIVGGARVRDWEIFWKNVRIFGSAVKRQIEVANPTIIIASGTIDFFKHFGFLENSISYPKTYRNYYVTGKQVVLDCYHLGQHTISQQNFCDDIILAVQDTKNRGLLN